MLISHRKMHSNILNHQQQQVIKKLGFLDDFGIYLAGGTALALQLGHRTSLDLDFYTKGHFDSVRLLKVFQDNFAEVIVDRSIEDTLLLEVEKVHFSLFYYPYDLLKKPISFKNIKLASCEDIAAMKIIAISMRGKRRDFIDICYLLRKFSLDKIMKLTFEKYPTYQPMPILKGLRYFVDAEKEDDLGRGIKVFDKDFVWEKAKKEIIEKVIRYQREMVGLSG